MEKSQCVEKRLHEQHDSDSDSHGETSSNERHRWDTLRTPSRRQLDATACRATAGQPIATNGACPRTNLIQSLILLSPHAPSHHPCLGPSVLLLRKLSCDSTHGTSSEGGCKTTPTIGFLACSLPTLG